MIEWSTVAANDSRSDSMLILRAFNSSRESSRTWRTMLSTEPLCVGQNGVEQNGVAQNVDFENSGLEFCEEELPSGCW